MACWIISIPPKVFVILRALGLLFDGVHQPVARTVEQRRGRPVFGGDGLRVERGPQLGGTVVEREAVVDRGLRAGLAGGRREALRRNASRRGRTLDALPGSDTRVKLITAFSGVNIGAVGLIRDGAAVAVARVRVVCRSSISGSRNIERYSASPAARALMYMNVSAPRNRHIWISESGTGSVRPNTVAVRGRCCGSIR